ncbi:MAG TPA: TIGR02281 family clan AA aspartic protease [Allosphingosinicella sp.]|jgi:aspartyl protease family protein|nr:TIGR02281 family clan AA aspartic protease [Allosphingosinicella sp.]
MQKAFVLVILLGAGIGLMWPSAQWPAPELQAATSGGETILKRRSDGHFYVDAQVNGELVNFVVDTGATDVVLPVGTARRLGIPFSTGEFDVIGRGASGPVRGKVIRLDKVSVDGKEVRDVAAAIAEGLDQPLLGQAYLSRISSVEMSKDRMRLQ